MQQPADRFSPTPVPTDSLVALADASNQLRNLQRRLSLAQAAATPLPATSRLPAQVDDRMGSFGTRARKSATDPRGVDRMSSEAYPLARPPRIDFLPGDNSRLQGRNATVVYA